MPSNKYLDYTGLAYLWGKIEDKIKQLAATATPLMDGTAAVGSSSKYAKEDHVHPKDTSKLDTTASAGMGAQSTHYEINYEYWKIRTQSSGGSVVQSNYIQGYNAGADMGIKLYVSAGSGSSKVENTLTMTSTSTSISKLPTPTEDTDAANKKYVDDSIAAVTDTNTTYTLSISSNVITLTPSSGTAQSITLPVYNGSVSSS